MSTCILRKSYRICTPESAEQGDYAEHGWEDEEGTEYTFSEAVRELRWCEPSSSEFHPGVWYCMDDAYTDFRTGAETSYDFHITASVGFQRRLYAWLTRKRA